MKQLIESFQGNTEVALQYNNDYRTFSWTYDELYRRIRGCAGYLEKRDVGPGDRILLWDSNSPYWVIAYFGALYRGCTVVPADMLATSEQVQRQAAEADVALSIQSRLKPELDIPTAETRELLEKAQQHESRNPYQEAEPALLVYTSGTTGEPKGVPLTVENLQANIDGVTERVDISSDDHLLSLLPLSHMFEQMCGLLVPLSQGATITYVRSRKPSAIFRVLNEERITKMITVPRILQSFKDTIEDRLSGWKRSLFESLRTASRTLPIDQRRMLFPALRSRFGSSFDYFVSGGAPLAPQTEAFWNDLGFKVIQGYGLTECSPVVTATRPETARFQTVGPPLSNVDVQVRDDGEIAVKGPNVFEGYHKRADATAETFDGDWFLTGDVGSVDGEALQIKGRKKNVIVKPSGINVHPEDIENHLDQHDQVKESCVIGRGEEETICAVLRTKEGTETDAIMAEVNDALNEAQRIQDVLEWPEEEFPKTPTMKIKRDEVRNRLAKQESEAEVSGSGSKVHEILSAVSDTHPQEIDPADTLADELQIDSIGRVELVSRIERRFNVDFDENRIDEETTVEELSQLIDEESQATTGIEFPHWLYNPVVKKIRNTLQECFHFPIGRMICDTTVEGREHLSDVDPPVIFIANHLSYFDKGIIQDALPSDFRYDLSTPAWAEWFEEPWSRPLKRVWKAFAYYYGVLSFSIYPFSQEHSFTEELRFTGTLLDKGENILIFPEGLRDPERLREFQPGVAVLVQNLQVPVVPVAHSGLEHVFPKGAAIPSTGEVTVRFGEPLRFSTESRDEILNRCRSAVEELQKS